MEVSGDPAAHVKPVHRALGRGAVFFVQQHQLLLGSHGTSFQHALQLGGTPFLQPAQCSHARNYEK